MQYRTHPGTGDQISEIGLGTANLYRAGLKEGVSALRAAYEAGVNYYDLATSDQATFPIFREALHDVREHVLYQIHFGADYTKGAYGWSLNLDTVKRSVALQLELLGTDRIDYGFIHCQDEEQDWDCFQKNGILDYIRELMHAGVVRHLGLSSHTPKVIRRITGELPIDMLMFSINPGYDASYGEFANGTSIERHTLYADCASKGIGISVMKPFSGGQLLDDVHSPFGRALSRFQCIHYALDRPGVLTVLPGVRNTQDVLDVLAYEQAADTEKDYSLLGSLHSTGENRCVYCGHCAPCPAGLDIALIHKYYDLAEAGDDLAVQHYASLSKKASDCLHCGHCDSRCPFKAHPSEQMRKIADCFERR